MDISDIDFHSDKATYLQIADYYRRQVALGRLRPGERLPAIRELAQKLSLDAGTVARAYRELERHGIIFTRRGGGSFISLSASQKDLAEQQRKYLGTLLEKAILEAFGLGFTTEDVEAAFTLRLAEWRERRVKSSSKSRASLSQHVNEIRFWGSHDIAVELLASHLATLYDDARFTTSFVGSMAGLMALSQGEADIAGAHLLDSDTGEFNIPFVTRLMPNDSVVLINLVQRVQGLMLAAGNPKHITGIGDLRRKDITFVNRQKGSGTRTLLDYHLINLGIAPNDVTGYDHQLNTHIAVASVVAEGEADVALGAQSAASAASLDFIPLFKERFDLVAMKERFEDSPLQKVEEVIGSESYHKMLHLLPGYDLTETGNIRVVEPRKK